MDLSLPLAFTLGLFSTFHCVGMCGGIVGALGYGISPERRVSIHGLSLFMLAYNGGRIASYALAGGFISLAGGWLADAGILRTLLQMGAALLIILIGLHIGEWFPRLAVIEQIGQPIWRRIEPLAHSLHPVRRPATAFLYGVLWGWVPCGLVYSVLLSAAAVESWSAGALYMAVFGLGTLPSMMATGLLMGRIRSVTRHSVVRRLVAVSVILMGIISMWYALPLG